MQILETPRHMCHELDWSRASTDDSIWVDYNPSKNARDGATPIVSCIGISPPTSDFSRLPCASKVCGFHMHAIEWHAMQALKNQDESVHMLAIADRAGCSRFNLSVTRWFDVGLNSLEKLPFTDVNCFCNIPMVVSCIQAMHPNQPQAYNLICVNRDVRNSTSGVNSCSRVLPINKIRYDARSSPVHGGPLSSDLWLHRAFGQNRPPEYYFFTPEVADGPKPILVSKIRGRLDFSKPPQAPSPLLPTPKNFCALRYRSSRRKLSLFDPVLHAHSPSQGQVASQIFEAKASNATRLFNTDGYLSASIDIESSSLSILSELQSYDRVMHPLTLFGLALSPPNILDKHIHGAIGTMIHWNNQQEAANLQVVEGMETWNQTNKDLAKRCREEHADLVLQMTNMTVNASLMTRIKCKVCYEGTLTEFLLPCGHMVLCRNCLRQVSACPICRRPPIRTQRVSWGSKACGAELSLSERLLG